MNIFLIEFIRISVIIRFFNLIKLICCLIMEKNDSTEDEFEV